MKKTVLIYLVLCISSIVSWGQTVTPWQFNIYNFGGLQTESVTVNRSVNLANGAGYDGMIIRIASDNLPEVDSYLARASNKVDFDIHAAFYVLYDKQGSFNPGWKTVVDKLVGTGVRLWLISGRSGTGVSESDLLTSIETIVTYANQNKVPVLLYPHSFNMIDHAEQVVDIIEELPPNLEVDLALIIDHEFRYGNGHRIEELIYEVKDYLGDVVISGSDTVIDNSYFPNYVQGSDRLIEQTKAEFETATLQPLGQGQFDLRRVFYVLKDIEYSGEIGYINHRFDASNGWNLSPDDYLEESMTIYTDWMMEVFPTVTGLSFESPATGTLFPNPTASGRVRINLNQGYESLEIRVYNVLGELVNQSSLNNKIEFQLPQESGVYFVELMYNGEKHSFRVLRN